MDFTGSNGNGGELYKDVLRPPADGSRILDRGVLRIVLA